MSGPILIRTWPRAIAHIDADAFFASVEQAINPKLKGKPVITGAERGIVAAASYEAKAKGVKRGVPLYEVKRICPDCIFVPSDYETYSIFSKRMFSIMRRFSPTVEEYSIDEGFIDLTGLRRLHRCGYKDIAKKIQKTIESELDITVSVGISLSKSLAKLCSKFRKPHGLTAVGGRHIHHLLKRIPLEGVWGFGPNSVALLEKHGLKTALDFIERPKSFASKLLGKVGREIWAELRGEYIHRVSAEERPKQVSISKAKTFTPPSSSKKYVWARALRNLESACIKARRHGLAASRIVLFLRSQSYDTSGSDVKLDRPTSSTNELVPYLKELFDMLYKPRTLYRATSVVLAELTDAKFMQFDLFSDPNQAIANERAFEAVDEAAKYFGKHAVFLADCAELGSQHSGDRGKESSRKKDPLKGETSRQHIGVPLLGKAK